MSETSGLKTSIRQNGLPNSRDAVRMSAHAKTLYEKLLITISEMPRAKHPYGSRILEGPRLAGTS